MHLDPATNPVADAFYRTLADETELLVSLSVAVIGGLFALVSRRSAPVHPPIQCGIVASLALASCSVLFGLIVLGMLIEMAPVIFHTQFHPGMPFSLHYFESTPYRWLRLFALVQQTAFFLSVIVAAIVFYKDRNLQNQGDNA